MRILLLAAALLPLASCATVRQPGNVAQPETGWRSMVTGSDRERLRDWRQAWVRALQRDARLPHLTA